ncbi:hypothetical protein STENOSP10_29780 [Stenotrophomonas sepilia]|uniref:Uncharacterized protein n=1 Tax=Stenotrophomonas sepilia TaxID=2860290 RepID=A0ABQ6QF06_9GAMM|nr:hypothetical protein STENOSP10_29780 [Stenotrophomonas sepilia]
MNEQLQPLPAPSDAEVSSAYCSATLWSDGMHFLQVHHGYFLSWEAAEDFASDRQLHLERRSNALFLVGAHGASFVPDQALQIYRVFETHSAGAFDMELDDLLEVVDVELMVLRGVGSMPVRRGVPIVAQSMSAAEFQAANPVANDGR